MNTQHPRQSYLDLIQAQIDANPADADELMVQRLYGLPGFAELIMQFMGNCGKYGHRADDAIFIAHEIEKAVFAAIEKSDGEMAEIEAMQTPDPEDFDDVAADGNAMLDLQGARRV